LPRDHLQRSNAPRGPHSTKPVHTRGFEQLRVKLFWVNLFKHPTMKISLFTLAALGSLIVAPALLRAESAPAAQVDVTYVSPEDFSDFKDSSMSTPKGREYLSSELTKHIKAIAKERLAPNRRLEIRFIDINLAGEYEPQRGPRFNDVRIIKEIYPPRMVLEFRLLDSDGKVLSEGKRQLIDPVFQSTTSPAFDSDPLRYDKELLTKWLRSEFPKKT